MRIKRSRIVLRFGVQIHELLLGAAEVEDIRVGTLASRALAEEIDKVAAVGVENCFVDGSKAWDDVRDEYETGEREYYLLPKTEKVMSYMVTRLDDEYYPQMSLYLTNEQLDTLGAIVKRQRIQRTIARGQIVSYRFAVGALMLNSPVCKKLLTDDGSIFSELPSDTSL